MHTSGHFCLFVRLFVCLFVCLFSRGEFHRRRRIWRARGISGKNKIYLFKSLVQYDLCFYMDASPGK